MRDYQYSDEYVEGNKVYYQYQDLNAWLGPAEVVYHRDNKVWLYNNRNLQKVAECKVKPYELVPREGEKNKEDDKTSEESIEIEYSDEKKGRDLEKENDMEEVEDEVREEINVVVVEN